MNLYTYFVKVMKLRSPADAKQEEFICTLNKIHNELANLLEDPLFIDAIHGEQEVAFDQALELIDLTVQRLTPGLSENQTNQFDLLELSAVDAD